ncbi:MAG: hypothetical protein U0793_15240 [Gemmataceae bacterium]
MSTSETAHPRLEDDSLWLRFLYARLGASLTVPGACLLWAVAQAALFAILAGTQGTLWSAAAGDLPLLHDATFLAYLFLVPLCFGLLHYGLALFRRYLSRIDEVLNPASRPLSSRALHHLAQATLEDPSRARLLFTVLGFVVFLYNAYVNRDPARFYGAPGKWDGAAYPLSYVLARLLIFIVWVYWLPLWASVIFRRLRVMARLSERMVAEGWLRLSPYHPDGFGGLGRLAAAASWVGYLILAGSVVFLAPALRPALLGLPLHIGNYIGLAAYVILAAIGLLAPVFLLHRCVGKIREKQLMTLSSAFDDINERAAQLQLLAGVFGNADDPDATLERRALKALADEELGRSLETAQRLREQWLALPAWPVATAALIRFLVSVLAPPIAFVVVNQTLTGGH